MEPTRTNPNQPEPKKACSCVLTSCVAALVYIARRHSLKLCKIPTHRQLISTEFGAREHCCYRSWPNTKTKTPELFRTCNTLPPPAAAAAAASSLAAGCRIHGKRSVMPIGQWSDRPTVALSRIKHSCTTTPVSVSALAFLPAPLAPLAPLPFPLSSSNIESEQTK